MQSPVQMVRRIPRMFLPNQRYLTLEFDIIIIIIVLARAATIALPFIIRNTHKAHDKNARNPFIPAPPSLVPIAAVVQNYGNPHKTKNPITMLLILSIIVFSHSVRNL